MKIISLFLALFLIVSTPVRSQDNSFRINPKGLVLPVVLIGAGAIGGQIDAIKEIDFGLPSSPMHTHTGFVLEDAVQYAPVAAFYALNMGGLKSAHNLKDGTALVAASYCITAAATYALKKVVDERRPNGADYDAFPSGHAAVSFMGAELLRLEYKDHCPWIGYAGYAAATYTSLARLRHSEHWFHDLLAGAGVGILGTRVAYWAAPWLHNKLFPAKAGGKEFSMFGMPFYNGNVAGVSLAMVF